MEISISKLTRSSLRIAEAAAEVIRKVAGGDLEICDKAADGVMPDLQTAADRRSEALIVTALRELFPGLKIVAEEGGAATTSEDWEIARQQVIEKINGEVDPANEALVDQSRIIVWVDPLDGTSDFVKRQFDCVSVLIGISCDTVPVAGVILRPFNNSEAIWGGNGFGINFSAGVNISEPEEISRCNQLRVTTTGSRSTPVIDAALDRLAPSQVLRVGGAGYKYWLLLTNQVDVYAYPRPGLKLWDVCAGDALLRLVGGTSTTPDGEVFVYSDKETAAILTSGIVASTACVEELRRDILEKISIKN